MKQYFAQEDAESLISELDTYNSQWQAMVAPYQSGIGAVWARNLNYYYGNVLSGNSDTSLSFFGGQGELIQTLCPEARTINTQFLALVTKQKLVFEPIALSTDAATLADTRVAAALCKKIADDQDLDQKSYKCLELASLMGAGYIYTSWNPSKGRLRGANPETGKPIFTGALEMRVLNPFDVTFLYFIENFKDHDWVKIRTLRNRWDLVAAHPELEDQIKMLPAAYSANDFYYFSQFQTNEDMVWVYEFFHKTSAALPNGRYLVFSDKNTVFFDQENPYRDEEGAIIPLAEMKPESIQGTGFGYPKYSDVMPMQEMLDHNISAISTNNNAFAVKSIANPLGNDVNVKHIQGLKFISYRPMNVQGGGKPEVLDLNTGNGELYKFSDFGIQRMQQMYALNGAVRGEPPSGVTAASAIATLSANAIEFTQSFSKAYVGAIEEAMQHAILCYRNFAKEPEVISITGPNDSSIAKQFVGSDLDTIQRIRFPLANPILATAAGRLEIANQLLQTGQFSINKYLSVLEGAPVKELYEEKFDEENYMQEENDAMRQGKIVEAIVTDDHALHIQEHKSLLDNLEIRANKQISSIVLEHIYKHYELAKQTDPMLYQMIKTGQLPLDLIQQSQMAEAQSLNAAQGIDPAVGVSPPGGAVMEADIASPAEPKGSLAQAQEAVGGF